VASKLNGTANPDQGRLYLPLQPNVGFSPDSGRTAAVPRTAGLGQEETHALQQQRPYFDRFADDSSK
jgi:hypothetical protein